MRWSEESINQNEEKQRFGDMKEKCEIVEWDDTHILVDEECRERDTGELNGICRTWSKKERTKLRIYCVLLVAGTLEIHIVKH